MLLVEVVAGEGVCLSENSTLKQPPMKIGKKRYDSVIGRRHGTWIWVVYDNARAYPTYVIEYKTEEN